VGSLAGQDCLDSHWSPPCRRRFFRGRRHALAEQSTSRRRVPGREVLAIDLVVSRSVTSTVAAIDAGRLRRAGAYADVRHEAILDQTGAGGRGARRRIARRNVNESFKECVTTYRYPGAPLRHWRGFPPPIPTDAATSGATSAAISIATGPAISGATRTAISGATSLAGVGRNRNDGIEPHEQHEPGEEPADMRLPRDCLLNARNRE